MTNKSKQSNKFPLILIAVGVLGVGALAGYAKFGPANRVPEDQLRREESAAKDSPNRRENDEVLVMKPEYQGDELVFKTTTEKTPEGEDARKYAVREYLKSISAIPKEAKLLDCTVSNGIATLNFNSAFAAGYGTEDERTIVEGILTVLGQFDDVEGVIFHVDGQPVDTLGNIDLGGPQKVIRPERPTPKDPGSKTKSPAPQTGSENTVEF